jgi:hypothetical protein
VTWPRLRLVGTPDEVPRDAPLDILAFDRAL